MKPPVALALVAAVLTSFLATFAKLYANLYSQEVVCIVYILITNISSLSYYLYSFYSCCSGR